MKRSRLRAGDLVKKGVPAVLIPGILAAVAFGWNASPISSIRNWYGSARVFPTTGIVKTIEDGDTIVLANGKTVRLLAINAPERGTDHYTVATKGLSKLVQNKRVYLEYDRYQDDKFGRLLAWVWVGCERIPDFTPPNYMFRSKNESNKGLLKNPVGCIKGTLVNEEMVDRGFAELVVYADRGELKYEERMRSR